MREAWIAAAASRFGGGGVPGWAADEMPQRRSKHGCKSATCRGAGYVRRCLTMAPAPHLRMEGPRGTAPGMGSG